jgi:hypothetical protein
MSFVKSVFVVRNVKTIVALASVFGIIFLSCMMIDKDNSIAQAQGKYKATSYIKIEGPRITKHEGLKGGDYGVRASLDRQRNARGDFTLIEIVTEGGSLYILASDVCVCTDVQDAEKGTYRQPEQAKEPQLEEMNKNLDDKFLYLEVPGKSCYRLNNRWL